MAGKSEQFKGLPLEKRCDDAFSALMNQLADEALGKDNQKAKADLQELLGLDELNFSYFLALYRKQARPGEFSQLMLDEPGKKGGNTVAYSTATASDELMAGLPLVEHEDLKSSSKGYGDVANDVVLWVKKMQAGTGSSMVRTSYLARQKGIAESEVKIGAKGIDLFVTVPDPQKPATEISLSLAEVQMIQLILDAKEKEFGGIIFHDIVGTETETSVEELWKKRCYLDFRKTYREFVDSHSSVGYSGRTYQDHLPTLGSDGKLTYRRHSPGGHAVFGVDAILAAIKSDSCPVTKGKALISVVSNGEDLSTTPDRFMVGWMKEEKIPIVMVTTDKTEIDFKGGQIALVPHSEGGMHITIVEQAQAETSGQKKYFEQLGLREGDRVVYFNTNMALYNYEVLVPRLKKLVDKIGDDKLLDIIAPDLILNKKKQKDKDQVERQYVQMEGAMGSTLLNLDQYWREQFNEPLVYFINVSRNSRTEFFSPLKTPFDFLMQFHSDRFQFDPKTMRLRNQRPGHLPLVVLKGSNPNYYKDVITVLKAFQGTSLKALDELEIKGDIQLTNAILKGKVSIESQTGKVEDLSHLAESSLPREQEKLVLENVKVTIDKAGKLQTSSL